MLTFPPPPVEKEYVFVPVEETNLNYPKGLRFLKEAYDRIRNIRLHFLRFLRGWKVFQKTGQTPPEALTSLINLFCMTHGLSNSILHFFTRSREPKYQFPTVKGFLGDSPKDIERALKAIRRDGFYVFPQRLSSELIDKIRERAIKTPARTDLKDELVYYDPKRLEGTRYSYGNQTALAFHEIQDLITDPSLLSLGQEYLGSRPTMDLVNVAIVTNFLNYPSELTAQFYHFDMDRIRWLKVFVYLTDVDSDTSPLCFVKGTHKPFTIPEEILRQRYTRLPDELIRKYYTPDRIIEITGKRGTVFALDTRGLHKGKYQSLGSRFIMQFEFVSNLFGAPIFHANVKTKSQALLDAKEKYPSIYEVMKIESR